MAAQLVPVAIMMLGSYSSRELCADMSLCSAASTQRLLSPQPLQLHTSSGCSMCKYLAGRAGGALSLEQASPSAEALSCLLEAACEGRTCWGTAGCVQAVSDSHIVNHVMCLCLQACADLPAELQAQCGALVSSTGEHFALASPYCCSCTCCGWL